jgi:acyl carrier protein
MTLPSFEFPDLERLLSTLLARELRLDVATIEGDRPFTHYGLDSLAALTIAGDLEERLSVELESTLLWDCPTVDTLAAHLHGQLERRGVLAAASGSSHG